MIFRYQLLATHLAAVHLERSVTIKLCAMLVPYPSTLQTL